MQGSDLHQYSTPGAPDAPRGEPGFFTRSPGLAGFSCSELFGGIYLGLAARFIADSSLDAIVVGRLVKQEGAPYGTEEEAWLEAVDAA
jgi:hypothetical protein